jgi:hypothetical protein
MSMDLRQAALETLLAQCEQLRERADILTALHNRLARPHAPTHDRFDQLARETQALGWEDYADRFASKRALRAWLDNNTYPDTGG